MPKKYINAFTGGLNELTRPDLLKDDELQECINYNIDGTGVLTKRSEPDTFDAGLDALLGSLFNVDSSTLGEILFMSDPYYPPKKPDDMAGDFMLLFYGTPTPGNQGYELFLVYKKIVDSSSDVEYWDYRSNNIDVLKSLKETGGVVFDQNNLMKASVGEQGIIVTDSINVPMRIYVDQKGEINSGLMGLVPPLSKIVIEPITGLSDSERTNPNFRSDAFTESTTDYVCEPGFIQMCYTVVSKSGEESNPSPLSDTADYQFIKKDVDGNLKHYVRSIAISNLAVPNVSEDVKNDLIYFNVYARSVPYLEDSAAFPMQFVQQFRINNKSISLGLPGATDTNNNFIVTSTLGGGRMISYENDSSPIAGMSEQVSEVVFLADIQTGFKLPYIFEKVVPIEINNLNRYNYVDIPIDIRIYDTLHSFPPDEDRKGLKFDDDSEFNWEDLMTYPGDVGAPAWGSRGLLSYNSHKIRIYDQDATTPLRVAYVTYNTSKHFVDLRIIVPYLTTGPTTLYFAWGGEGVIGMEGGGSGITHALYGEFISQQPDILDATQLLPIEAQRLYLGRAPFSVINRDQVLCLDMTTIGPPLKLDSRNGKFLRKSNESTSNLSWLNRADMQYSAPTNVNQSNWSPERNWSGKLLQTYQIQNDIPSTDMDIELFPSVDTSEGTGWNTSTSNFNYKNFRSPYIVNNTCAAVHPFGDLGVGAALQDMTFTAWCRVFIPLQFMQAFFKHPTGTAATDEAFNAALPPYYALQRHDPQMSLMTFGGSMYRPSAGTGMDSFPDGGPFDWEGNPIPCVGFNLETGAENWNTANLAPFCRNGHDVDFYGLVLTHKDEGSGFRTPRLTLARLNNCNFNQEITSTYSLSGRGRKMRWGSRGIDPSYTEQLAPNSGGQGVPGTGELLHPDLGLDLFSAGDGNDPPDCSALFDIISDMSGSIGADPSEGYLNGFSFNVMYSVNPSTGKHSLFCGRNQDSLASTPGTAGIDIFPADWPVGEIRGVESSIAQTNTFRHFCSFQLGGVYGRIATMSDGTWDNEVESGHGEYWTSWHNASSFDEGYPQVPQFPNGTMPSGGTYGDLYYQNCGLMMNKYLSANNEKDLDYVNKLAYCQHPTRESIGTQMFPVSNTGYENNNNMGNYNRNIYFNDSQDLSQRSFRKNNMVKWSNLYGYGFPDLNYALLDEKVTAIIKAPSFLKFKYENTLIIFTRNTISRFILTGTPGDWAGNVDNVITEYSQYGLYAPKSLVMAGNSLIWLSEAGIIKWDSEGFSNISEGKISVELNEEAIGFFNELDSQYILNYRPK